MFEDEPEEGSVAVQPTIELKLTPGREDTGTIVISGEGHTLGNALRYVLAKNPDIELAGYSVPHPADDNVHIRIQTDRRKNIEVAKAFRSGVKDLCQHIKETYEIQTAHYTLNAQLEEE